MTKGLGAGADPDRGRETAQESNEGLIGTPDVVADSFGIDIKNSWDLWTFAEVDEARVKKTYYAVDRKSVV